MAVKYKVIKFVQTPIEVGIFPVNALNDKSKVVIENRLKDDGIFPLNLLFPTENKTSLDIVENIVEGKFPVNLLYPKLRVKQFVSFVME